MDCFRFLPCSSFVRIVPCLANIIFYEYALITHRKPTQKKRRKQHNNDKVLENGTCSVGALTITNLRKARHLRWGNVSSHTRLNCLAETLIRSVFPFSTPHHTIPLHHLFCQLVCEPHQYLAGLHHKCLSDHVAI